MNTDPIPLVWFMLVLLVLVLFNAFFVAAEYAIVKIRLGRLETLIQQGNLRARAAQGIHSRLSAYLSACQLGITLTSLGLGWLAEPAVAQLVEPLFRMVGAPDEAVRPFSIGLGFLLLTVVHIVIGEQFPKIYASRRPEAITLGLAIPLMLFYWCVRPLIWIVNTIANALLRKVGIEPEKEETPFLHSEEEIRSLMKESHNSGLINQTEFTLVDNIFEFAETNAKEIMIPRTEMVCLYANRTIQDNMDIAIGEMLTRYPVCDPDKDNIVGFVHIKDLLRNDAVLQDLRTVIRPLMSVPESMPISVLLKLMQKHRTQIALLIDEYGGTSGLVTVEDILEEIVGEIQDEFDEERPAIERQEEGVYSVDGLLLIEELNEQLGLQICSEDYDTIGGWMYAQVPFPPRTQQTVHVGGAEFTVEEVDHLRISRIRVRVEELGAGVGEDDETVA